VSYNGIKFDEVVISAVLAGLPYEKVKQIANALIQDSISRWEIRRRYGLVELKWDHIDLMEVTPGFVSLKAYGARMHMPWLKDLPYAHDIDSLTEEQFAEVDQYCENDLNTTEELYDRLKGALDLRRDMSLEYSVDMRSKSDTQMAEAAFMVRLGLKKGSTKVPYSIYYKLPEYIQFSTPHLVELTQRIVDQEYLMNQKTGHVILPEFLEKQPVKLNAGEYQLGVGGIHSKHDKKVCHVATKEYFIFDIDAASYYPSIILNLNLIPKNIGERFIEEYKRIYFRRLEAKKNGDKATDAVLKISLNGTFGKLMERWSALYSPDLGLAVTLTGQLTLLTLMERLESIGACSLSANTDGIAIGARKEIFNDVERVVSEFSKISGFSFEYTHYKTLAMKDVNNYLAITKDGKIKSKGIYAVVDTDKTGKIIYKENLSKNPTAPVCAKAVACWLRDGVPFMDTIRAAPFKEFISVRGVTGGGFQGENHLGRVVRWYQSTEQNLAPIVYGPGKKEGDKVAKTDGGKECMVLPIAFPTDLHYNWYHNEAINIAINLGCKEYLTDEEIALVTPPPKVRKPRKTK